MDKTTRQDSRCISVLVRDFFDAGRTPTLTVFEVPNDQVEEFRESAIRPSSPAAQVEQHLLAHADLDAFGALVGVGHDQSASRTTVDLFGVGAKAPPRDDLELKLTARRDFAPLADARRLDAEGARKLGLASEVRDGFFEGHAAIIRHPLSVVNRHPYRHPGESVGMDLSHQLLRLPLSALPGERVRALRKFRGLNGRELAKLAGIKPPSLSDLETGESKSLKGTTLIGIARALNANPEWINTGKGSPFQTGITDPLEDELVHIHRTISPGNKNALLAMARGLLESESGRR